MCSLRRWLDSIVEFTFVFYGEYEDLYALDEDSLEDAIAKGITRTSRIWVVLNTSCTELFDLVEWSRLIYYNFSDSLHKYLLIIALVCGCASALLAIHEI